MIVKGKLITCKREVKEFKGRKADEALYITLAEVELSKDQKKELENAFKDAGPKFTPDWVKDFAGYVNVKTQYALPCRDLEGNDRDSIEDFIKTFPWMGAEVALSLNVKEGAVYPNAIIFKSSGKEFNPFAEFDKDGEED